MSSLESGSLKQIIIVSILLFLFISFALIFIGHGLTEWNKKNEIKHLVTAFFGGCMIIVGLYVSKLLFNF